MATILDLPFVDLFLKEDGKVFLYKESAMGKVFSVPKDNWCDAEALLEKISFKGKEGDYSVFYNGQRLRGCCYHSTSGWWHAVRRGRQNLPDLKSLGLPRYIVDHFLSDQVKSGLILFCGTTASGKTTSASAFVAARLRTFGGNAITLEDPPELPLEGLHGEFGVCFQMIIQDGAFDKAIPRTKRQGSPPIIYLGEIRRPKEASEALRLSIDGHLIVATVHAGGIRKALRRMIAMAADYDGEIAQYNLAEGLVAVVYQELITTENERVKLKTRHLFTESEFSAATPIRAKIRDGKIEQLGTQIQAQMSQAKFSLFEAE